MVVLGGIPTQRLWLGEGITCWASSLAHQSALPSPTSCSGSLRTEALPRRPRRSRRSQRPPAAKGHPVWHTSAAQGTRNSMPRRECTVQDSLESHSRDTQLSLAWSSAVGGGRSWEDVWGSSASSCCGCCDRCLAGTHLWTLCKSWTGQVSLVRPRPAAIWKVAPRLGAEAEALPWCRSSLGNSSPPPALRLTSSLCQCGHLPCLCLRHSSQ